MKIQKNKITMKQDSVDSLFSICGGTTPSTAVSEYWLDGTIPWIGPVDMNKPGKYISRGRKNITSCAANKIKSKKILKNSIIISTRAPIGYIKINSNDIFTNQGCHSLHIKGENITDYFYYFFLNNISVLKSISTGTTFQEISKKNLSSLNINYPDLKQQKNIAYVLSKQEKQIETIKRLIKNVEKRNQYYSEKLLSGELKLITNEETGQIEFHENTEWKEIILNGNIIKSPLDWEISIFSSYSKFTVGTPIHSNNFNYEKKGLMYLRTGDVWKDASSSKDIAYYDGEASLKFIKKENDYLISLKGYNKKIGEGTLGLVTNFNKQIGIVCDNMYLVTPKENDLVAYTAYVTRMPYIQNIILKSAVGSTARFATKMIDKIEWIFPKNIEYMLSVNQFFQKLDNEVFILEELQKKEEKRFQWMLDNLLSGEYEVIDED